MEINLTYREKSEFRRLTQGFDSSFDEALAVSDGWDTAPRAIQPELADIGPPLGHIAFMGDFEGLSANGGSDESAALRDRK